MIVPNTTIILCGLQLFFCCSLQIISSSEVDKAKYQLNCTYSADPADAFNLPVGILRFVPAQKL